MGIESKIPKAIAESIHDMLDGKYELVSLELVQIETKPERMETKVLAMTEFHMLLCSTKIPSKVELNMHILDIVTVESKVPTKLSVLAGTRRLMVSCLESDADMVDRVLLNLASLLSAVYPAVSFQKRIGHVSVSPADRWAVLEQKMSRGRGRIPRQSCDGFSHTYSCLCDQHGLPFMEDVAWDVDTIYQAQDTREFNLADFDHLEVKHLVPIVLALEHNTWFTRIIVSNQKLMAELIHVLLLVLISNTTIKDIVFSDIGVKWEFAQKLAKVLTTNEATSVTSIDLSGNYLEDRGLIHLCESLTRAQHGLVSLNLARTGVTAKGVKRLAEVLSQSPLAATSLRSLNLSSNSLKIDEVSTLFNFLAQPNAITSLNLSATECALDMVFGALLRGCCQNLCDLDLSLNPYPASRRGVRETIVPLAWKQFFAGAVSLKSVCLAETRLPAEALKSVLLGLSSNGLVVDVALDVSANGLGQLGAQVLEMCGPGITAVSTLDISNNGFDNDLGHLVGHLGKSRSVKKLLIGRNMTNIKLKHIPHVLRSIVEIFQSENTSIESLSLADSRMKTDTCIIINAIGTNSSLTEIDISGNQMGDVGARMLAKALQINTKLETVVWDRNQITGYGLAAVAAALERNYTLRRMPTPVNDLLVAMKMNHEKTEQAVTKIESLLQRNRNPRRVNAEQAYRLHQSCLVSATQQMIDKLVLQVQESIAMLEACAVSSQARRDITTANSLIKDANMSREILPRLQEVASGSEDGGINLQPRLHDAARDLHHQLELQLRKNVSDMLINAEDQYPAIFNIASLKEELRATSHTKSALPSSFTEQLLREQLRTDMLNKFSELNLAVASHISDKMVDTLLESLEDIDKKLMAHMHAAATAAPPPTISVAVVDDSSTDTAGDDDDDKDHESEKESRASLLRRKSSDRDLLAPLVPLIDENAGYSTTRKSLLSRRLRPQSVIAVPLGAHAPRDAQQVKAALRMVAAATQSPLAQECPPPRPPPPKTPTLPQAKTPPPEPKTPLPKTLPPHPKMPCPKTPPPHPKMPHPKTPPPQPKTNNHPRTKTPPPSQPKNPQPKTSSPSHTKPPVFKTTPPVSADASPAFENLVYDEVCFTPVPAPRSKRKLRRLADVSEVNAALHAELLVVEDVTDTDTIETVAISVDDKSDDKSDYKSDDTVDTTDVSTVDSSLDSRGSTPSSEIALGSPPSTTTSPQPHVNSHAPIPSCTLPPISVDGQNLEHLGKDRPRRVQKNRGAGRASQMSTPRETLSPIDSDLAEFYQNPAAVPTASRISENVTDSEKSKTDRNASVKKTGWSPFGNKPDAKGLAAGISNFFGRKSPSATQKTMTTTTSSESIKMADSVPPDSTSGQNSDVIREETVAKTESDDAAEMKNSNENVSEPKAAPPKRPPIGARMGFPGMADGAALMAEMRAKRAPAKPATVSRSEESKEGATTERPARSTLLDPKPVPTPRASSPIHGPTKPSDDVSGNGTKPQLRQRPPPVAPKPSHRSSNPPPPKPAFMPTSRFSVTAYLKQFQDPADDKPTVQPALATTTDSKKKRLSVRQHAAFLDRNSNEKPLPAEPRGGAGSAVARLRLSGSRESSPDITGKVDIPSRPQSVAITSKTSTSPSTHHHQQPQQRKSDSLDSTDISSDLGADLSNDDLDLDLNAEVKVDEALESHRRKPDEPDQFELYL